MNVSDFSGLKAVIVNWNRPADTLECVQSLINGSLPADNIILVDNGSRVDELSQLQEALPGIQVRRLDENRGFAGGYNFGIDLALKSGAERIFILNNDTKVAQDAISALLAAPWDVSVPKIYFYGQSTNIWSAGAQWRNFPPMVIMRGYQKRDSKRYKEPAELKYATACALMVRRQVFERVGLFDLEFESYFEDYDFTYRVSEAGFHIGYVPEARMWHKVSQSLGQTSAKRLWFQGRNSVLFYKKNKRFPSWALYSYLTWVCLREIVKLNFGYFPNFWRGVWDGMNQVNG